MTDMFAFPDFYYDLALNFCSSINYLSSLYYLKKKSGYRNSNKMKVKINLIV